MAMKDSDADMIEIMRPAPAGQPLGAGFSVDRLPVSGCSHMAGMDPECSLSISTKVHSYKWK